MAELVRRLFLAGFVSSFLLMCFWIVLAVFDARRHEREEAESYAVRPAARPALRVIRDR
jgi:TRAP-type C4-dicarboxylate transport system permease large subunit